MPSKKNDKLVNTNDELVNHPSHYTEGGALDTLEVLEAILGPQTAREYADKLPLECIDVIKAILETDDSSGSRADGAADYANGATLKYMWRCENKNGYQDLEKAKWYVNYVYALYVAGEVSERVYRRTQILDTFLNHLMSDWDEEAYQKAHSEKKNKPTVSDINDDEFNALKGLAKDLYRALWEIDPNACKDIAKHAPAHGMTPEIADKLGLYSLSSLMPGNDYPVSEAYKKSFKSYKSRDELNMLFVQDDVLNWIYLNPDWVDDDDQLVGQYVHMTISAKKLLEIYEETKGEFYEHFFALLADRSKQLLIDGGTQDFEKYDEEFDDCLYGDDDLGVILEDKDAVKFASAFALGYYNRFIVNTDDGSVTILNLEDDGTIVRTKIPRIKVLEEDLKPESAEKFFENLLNDKSNRKKYTKASKVYKKYKALFDGVDPVIFDQKTRSRIASKSCNAGGGKS